MAYNYHAPKQALFSSSFRLQSRTQTHTPRFENDINERAVFSFIQC